MANHQVNLPGLCKVKDNFCLPSLQSHSLRVLLPIVQIQMKHNELDQSSALHHTIHLSVLGPTYREDYINIQLYSYQIL